MRFLASVLFAAALFPSAAGSAPAAVSGQGALNLAQAERMAADLKQGMSVDEVRNLLGKPNRTSLRSDGGSTMPSQGTLQWTFAWTGASSPGILRVEFVSKGQEEWRVNSWQWNAY
jgi:hypothetical protein